MSYILLPLEWLPGTLQCTRPLAQISIAKCLAILWTILITLLGMSDRGLQGKFFSRQPVLRDPLASSIDGASYVENIWRKCISTYNAWKAN
ncbi:hypothetical protein MAP00_008518 [Monascus purpureus]|nr:hypothetical protein MAP00_008518 [Monascus purpureus]